MVPQQFRTAWMLTLAVLLGCAARSSRSQDYGFHAELSHFSNGAKNPDRARLTGDRTPPLENTNDTTATWVRPRWEEEILEAKLKEEPHDQGSLAAIIEKEATKRAYATLMSARLDTEDAELYLNQDPTTLRSPYDLETRRGISVFGRTAVESLGDYVDQNYHPGGIIRFVQETIFDDPFDKRIVSPFAPAYAGNPGEAFTRKSDIHFGLRHLASDNPMAFLTFSDKAEIDLTRRNPSFTLRNPFYIDRGSALVTVLAVKYPDWQVSHWSLPTFGATLAYVHGRHSINLTTSAGTCNCLTSTGGTESRYAEQVLLCTDYTF